MPGARRLAAKRIVAVVLFLALLLGTGLLVLVTILTSGSSSSSRAPVTTPPAIGPSATLSVVPSATPSVPASPRGTTVVAEAPPGGNSLAISGSGPSAASFSAATSSWTLKVSFDCGTTASDFRVTAADRLGATAATVARTGVGEDSRVIAGPGTFAIVIEGDCSWSIAATG